MPSCVVQFHELCRLLKCEKPALNGDDDIRSICLRLFLLWRRSHRLFVANAMLSDVGVGNLPSALVIRICEYVCLLYVCLLVCVCIPVLERSKRNQHYGYQLAYCYRHWCFAGIASSLLLSSRVRWCLQTVVLKSP
jgi:hypothetical protein